MGVAQVDAQPRTEAEIRQQLFALDGIESLVRASRMPVLGRDVRAGEAKNGVMVVLRPEGVNGTDHPTWIFEGESGSGKGIVRFYGPHGQITGYATESIVLTQEEFAQLDARIQAVGR